jgi:CheY-like chemotaxis protein
MNGVDATRELRKAGYRYLIVAITGAAMKEDIDEFLAVGADLVLPKPCKLSSLEILLDFIDRQGSLSSPGSRLVSFNGSMNWAPQP